MTKGENEEMSNEILVEKVEDFVAKVSILLPYKKQEKEQALQNLLEDIQEAMKETKETDPSIVFGNPRDVAKDLSRSQDWGTEPAGFFKRTVAFIIDFAIIAIFHPATILALLMVAILLNNRWDEFATELTRMFETIFDPSNPILLLISLLVWITICLSIGLFPLVSGTCYFVGFEGKFSTTLGKRIMGLKVVDESGTKLSWKQAFVRNLSKIGTFLELEFVLFDVLIGVLMQKAEKRRALDLLVETVVVQRKKTTRSG